MQKAAKTWYDVWIRTSSDPGKKWGAQKTWYDVRPKGTLPKNSKDTKKEPILVCW